MSFAEEGQFQVLFNMELLELAFPCMIHACYVLIVKCSSRIDNTVSSKQLLIYRITGIKFQLVTHTKRCLYSGTTMTLLTSLGH